MIFQVFQGLVFRLVLIGFDLVFPGVVFGISYGIDWIWFGIFFGVFTPCLVLLQYQIPDRDMSDQNTKIGLNLKVRLARRPNFEN